MNVNLMPPASLLDHAYVVLVLVIVFPFVGWWAYRLFLQRVERDGDIALVREYRSTMLWLLGLGGGAIALWLLHGRDLAGPGFTAPGGDSNMPAALVGGMLLGLAVRPLAAWRNPKFAESMRAQFARLQAFLPKTRQQLRWGLGVSVFAGVFEEIAYRGYLMAYLGHWLDPWWVLAVSSLVFGLAHLYQGRVGVVMTTLMGAVFGYFYLETGSLLLPILLHIAVDVSAMVTAWVVLRRDVEQGSEMY